jgi:hypothetical protein
VANKGGYGERSLYEWQIKELGEVESGEWRVKGGERKREGGEEGDGGEGRDSRGIIALGVLFVNWIMISGLNGGGYGERKERV